MIKNEQVENYQKRYDTRIVAGAVESRGFFFKNSHENRKWVSVKKDENFAVKTRKPIMSQLQDSFFLKKLVKRLAA